MGRTLRPASRPGRAGPTIRRMLPRSVSALALLALLGAAGCGQARTEPPRACLDGAAPVLRALRAAPAPVRLADGTSLSECVRWARSDASLQGIGAELTEAAARLAVRARARDAAALQMGYLVGASERAAARTNGIHAELVSRLRGAAAFDGAAGARRAAFARGRAAGRAGG